METKILLVEDDKLVAGVMCQFLTRSGFQVFDALSAEEAQEILKTEKINIVISDINLPGQDGIQFTKAIKKTYKLDVLVTTGYSSEYSYEDVVKIGANDLIFKPIRFEELLLRINRIIEERRLKNEREQMLKDLQRLSIRDPLTELYNSRYFYNQLHKEIKRTGRYFHPLSLIFVDIDKFKAINDTHGHMIGDKILLLIANKIRESLRSEDAGYRFAGDEFTVILPETNLTDAEVVADRIRSKIENENIVINGKKIDMITVSLGIAEYQKDEEMEKFIHRADLAMYKSKEGGGNKVVIATKMNPLSCGLNVEMTSN